MKALLKRVQNLSPHLPEELLALIAGIQDPGGLCDMVASALSLGPEERQTIVDALDIKERLRRVTALANHEIQILELGSKIQSELKEDLDKTQREYYLRQQLKTIQKELGEGEGEEGSEAQEIKKKLDAKDLPQEVRAEAEREVKRLARCTPPRPNTM